MAIAPARSNASQRQCMFLASAKGDVADDAQDKYADGARQPRLEDTVSRLKAEAAYFVADNGMRCAMIFFDMKESAEIPVIAEPLFIGLGAELELVPVMNAEDLRRGLKAAMEAV